MVLVALTLGLSVLGPVGVGAASAASASVPCTTVALVSAINTANAAGGGTTLTLASGCIYTLTVLNTAADGLPRITASITILGSGATIIRSSALSTPEFRIFEVASGGRLALTNLTVGDGHAPDGVGSGAAGSGGGAILNAGTLILNHATLSGNQAGSGAASTSPGGAGGDGGKGRDGGAGGPASPGGTAGSHGNGGPGGNGGNGGNVPPRFSR
jgi:hypothetical protein